MAFDEVCTLLVSHGWEDAGTSAAAPYKIVTRDSYPLPGKVITPSARKRFVLPGTNKRATVGKRTVNFYEAGQRQAINFEQFKTKDIEGIKSKLKEVEAPE